MSFLFLFFKISLLSLSTLLSIFTDAPQLAFCMSVVPVELFHCGCKSVHLCLAKSKVLLFLGKRLLLSQGVRVQFCFCIGSASSQGHVAAGRQEERVCIDSYYPQQWELVVPWDCCSLGTMGSTGSFEDSKSFVPEIWFLVETLSCSARGARGRLWHYPDQLSATTRQGCVKTFVLR